MHSERSTLPLAYLDPLPDLQWLQLSPAKPSGAFWHLVALGWWLQ